MMIGTLKDLFTLRAFSPKITDTRYTLRARLGAQPIGLLNIGASGVKVAKGIFGKKLKITNERFFPSAWDVSWDLNKEALAYLEKLSQNKIVAVSLGERLSIILKNNPNGVVLKSEWLQQTIDLGRQSVGAQVKPNVLEKLYKTLDLLGFTIARIQLTSINLINFALGNIDLNKNSPKVVAILDQAQLTLFKIEDGKISTLRSMLINLKALEKVSEETEALESLFIDILGTQNPQAFTLVQISSETPPLGWKTIHKSLPFLKHFKEKTTLTREHRDWEILCHE